MKKILFKGCGTAIATPFDNDSVNLIQFKKLLKYQIDNKADAIIVCGTTGEGATMSVQEKIDTIKCAVSVVNKRIPIIAGTGSNDTKQAIEMSQLAESLGVDGLLVVTPYYNKTTMKGLIEHFKAIASNVNIPIILYNVPSRTGVNIDVKTCFELSKIENIVAIKEASGNISQIAEISALCKDNLYIYSGNDDQIVPILSIGGLGVISVISNIYPDVIHNMIYNFFDGNFSKAKQMQLDILQLVKALFCEVNPIPIKYALNKMNFNFGKPRLPLVEISEENKLWLEKELQKFATLYNNF